MNILSIIENLPPAFYGVLIGSLLTIIGVALTNLSNTKQMRIQHEHERTLRSKERNLNLRREIYMDAMEALSTGITAIGRFSELNETPEALMQSYTSLSANVGKVTIVGHNETIEALANFQLELNGAFLRLSAQRDIFDAKLRKSQTIETKISALEEQLNRFSNQLIQSKIDQEHARSEQLQTEIERLEDALTTLRSENEQSTNQLMQAITNLLQTSMAEVSSLNKLLVPLISLMRTELELPFNEEHFARILEKGNKELENYMSAFFQDYQQTMLDEVG